MELCFDFYYGRNRGTIGQCQTNVTEIWCGVDKVESITPNSCKQRTSTDSFFPLFPSLMWDTSFARPTSGIKYWNKYSQQAGMRLKATAFKATTLHVKRSRREKKRIICQTVTSEAPDTCRASLLYKRMSLCPHGHKHLSVLDSIVPLTGKYVA